MLHSPLTSLNALVLVFLGGGLGSLLRYIFSVGISPRISGFPWATFAANVLACCIIGFVSYFYARGDLNTGTRLLMATGFCGGLSTFSTFSLETLQLLEKGNLSLALINVLISVAMCLLAVAIPIFTASK